MKRVNNQIKSSWVLFVGLGLMLLAMGCEPGSAGIGQQEHDYAAQEGALFVLGGTGSQPKSTGSFSGSPTASTKLVIPVVAQQSNVSRVGMMRGLKPSHKGQINISLVNMKGCCQLKSGDLVSTSILGCKLQGGIVVNPSVCAQPKEVCCVPENGVPFFTMESECADEFAGTIVNGSVCTEDPVSLCCGFQDGTVGFATNIDCAVGGGTPMPVSSCQQSDEDICCMTYGGTFIGSSQDCAAKNGVEVPMDVCAPPVAVCCLQDDTATVISEDACDDVGGTPVADEMCEEVCCEVDGSPVDVTLAGCEAQGGNVVDPEICEASTDDVCCELPSGPAIIAENDCLAQGGVVSTPDACQLCNVDLDPSVSLMITDPTILSAFPMEEVMDQLANLGPGGGNGQTGTELFQQWWSTQREREPGDPGNHPFCDDNGGTINGFPVECPRPEHELEDLDANSHHPTAIVNRFDLAPTNGAHCGEYRLVYAKTQGVLSGRNTIIFEGVLPNPDPSCGLVGCRPVVEFWASLEDEADTSVRAQMLHDFFFLGLPGFEPVVRPESYGLVPAGTPSGQIRTNQFMNFTFVPGQPFQSNDGWSLREFILTESCPGGICEMLVEQTTVKGNPSPSVWDGSSPLSAAYEADFVAQMNLQQPAVEDINNLGMETFEIYNSGESNSQGMGPNSANYNPSAGLSSAISNAIPGSSFLNSGDIAARAQAMTCGGCHQTSSGDNLGTQSSVNPDLMWPVQNPIFVHIDENSNLSLALTMPGGFLDRRKQVMEDFLLNTCGETCLTDPLIVMVDGAIITQAQFDTQVEAEAADFEKAILDKCGVAITLGTGNEGLAEELESNDAQEVANGTAENAEEGMVEEKEEAQSSSQKSANADSEGEDQEEQEAQSSSQKSSKFAGKSASSQGAGEQQAEELADSSDGDNGADEMQAAPTGEQCAAQMAQSFDSSVKKSAKPTPTDPLKATLSGSTTH